MRIDWPVQWIDQCRNAYLGTMLVPAHIIIIVLPCSYHRSQWHTVALPGRISSIKSKTSTTSATDLPPPRVRLCETTAIDGRTGGREFILEHARCCSMTLQRATTSSRPMRRRRWDQQEGCDSVQIRYDVYYDYMKQIELKCFPCIGPSRNCTDDDGRRRRRSREG